MEHVEHIIVGAGPAGLRAAHVLAEAGREVLVLEKNASVGPKTCGGGLSTKAVRLLQGLGLPAHVGVRSVACASFRGETPTRLDPEHARILTVSRERLGCRQAEWVRAAGAELRTDSAVTRIDLVAKTLTCNGRSYRFERLIGADGSGSAVRRALGLPTPRAFFAGEFNIPGVRELDLDVAFDTDALLSGYFWVFPHEDYTCIGAGGHKNYVRPASVRPYVEQRIRALGIDRGDTPYEGAAIEVDYHGCEFDNGVYLIGDAAGLPSGLTAEGIYAALVSGEDIARRILEPAYSMPRLAEWLRVKRSHDRIGRLWLKRAPRELSISVLKALCRSASGRRWVSAYFLEA